MGDPEYTGAYQPYKDQEQARRVIERSVRAFDGGTGHLSGGSSIAIVSRGASQTPSEVGSPGGEYAKHYKSTSKVRELAQEIVSLESRSQWLDEQNKILSSRLMKLQSSCVSKNLMVGGKQLKIRFFKAWIEVSYEMKLERHLEQQTRALDQCREVAQELGMALKQERDSHASLRASCENVKAQFEDVVGSNYKLQHDLDALTAKAALLQRRLEHAEHHVTKKNHHAMAVIGEGERYEKRKRDLMRELDATDNQIHNKVSYTMQEHRGIRQQAHETVEQSRMMVNALGNSVERPPPRPTRPRAVEPPSRARERSPSPAPGRRSPSPPPGPRVMSPPPPRAASPPAAEGRTALHGGGGGSLGSSATSALGRLRELEAKYSAPRPGPGPLAEAPEAPRRLAIRAADEVSRIDADGENYISREELEAAQRAGIISSEELKRQRPQAQLALPLPRRSTDRSGAWQAVSGSPVDGAASGSVYPRPAAVSPGNYAPGRSLQSSAPAPVAQGMGPGEGTTAEPWWMVRRPTG